MDIGNFHNLKIRIFWIERLPCNKLIYLRLLGYKSYLFELDNERHYLTQWDKKCHSFIITLIFLTQLMTFFIFLLITIQSNFLYKINNMFSFE